MHDRRATHRDEIDRLRKLLLDLLQSSPRDQAHEPLERAMMANTAASQAAETRASTTRNVTTAMSVEASRMVPTVTLSPDSVIRSWSGRISTPEREATNR